MGQSIYPILTRFGQLQRGPQQVSHLPGALKASFAWPKQSHLVSERANSGPCVVSGEEEWPRSPCAPFKHSFGS
ncbi:unnamed protein product [Protopolystoma xenopodis]|uniref:Uncharacterized protein n=1 Tax=Protopolystoma xenopodis TaxID=117903 RepID=A0A448WMB5_9PLAT|nr:unnamed protein product [Protopolystoma xenopodis]